MINLDFKYGTVETDHEICCNQQIFDISWVLKFSCSSVLNEMISAFVQRLEYVESGIQDFHSGIQDFHGGPGVRILNSKCRFDPCLVDWIPHGTTKTWHSQIHI